MPSRLQQLNVTPWNGGLVTSIDESFISPNQLTKADNVIFSTQISRLKREGINYDQFIGEDEEVIALYDYWYQGDSERLQRLAVFTSQGKLILVDTLNNTTETITDTGTAYVIPEGGLRRASMIAFDNRLMVATDEIGNVMKHYFPASLGGSGELEDVENTSGFEATPQASILQVYAGRLVCNDKTRPDRLHYSQAGYYNIWQGVGDSGAFDIYPGDGDPVGITAIMPPFKNNLFVAKLTKLYRFNDADITTTPIQKISDSIGCVAHQAVAAVDQDDVLFMSPKGVHRLSATPDFGDFQSQYASKDIQKSIMQDWQKASFKYIQAAYVAQINSVAFTIAEQSEARPNNVWLFNTELNVWYRWPKVICTAICKSEDVDRQRFYFGASNGHIGKSFSGQNYDVPPDTGIPAPVIMDIATGLINVDGNISTTKAFKKLSLIFKPVGSYSLQAGIKIDNYTRQNLVFNNDASFAKLGIDFILGQSVLGIQQVTAAYTQQIDGYGRTFKLNVQQSDVDGIGELLGFIVWYESAEYGQETRAGDNQ